MKGLLATIGDRGLQRPIHERGVRETTATARQRADDHNRSGRQGRHGEAGGRGRGTGRKVDRSLGTDDPR